MIFPDLFHQQLRKSIWRAVEIYQKTQLDSYTGKSISHVRLARLMGGDLRSVSNQFVLEAGCGAGRFTEILLQSGARVLAADLSEAVDANYGNCHHYDKYEVVQANLLHLPVAPQQFDQVICIGVIQHTPSPEETIVALCGYVKPGGLLVIDIILTVIRLQPLEDFFETFSSRHRHLFNCFLPFSGRCAVAITQTIMEI